MGLFSEGGVDMSGLLDSIKTDRSAAMTDLAGYGGQSRVDINSQYNTEQNKAMQQLASTGMANSTISPSIGALYGREKQSSLQRLMQSLAEQKAKIRSGYDQSEFQAHSTPQQPGMGWGILGSLLNVGGNLGAAAMMG